MDCEHGLWVAFLLLATADCLLNLTGVRVGGTLRPHSSLGQDVFSTAKGETVVTLKMKGQRGNVIENKGSRLENRGRSGNVIDSKGDTR